jgi:hypothetical protein
MVGGDLVARKVVGRGGRAQPGGDHGGHAAVGNEPRPHRRRNHAPARVTKVRHSLGGGGWRVIGWRVIVLDGF